MREPPGVRLWPADECDPVAEEELLAPLTLRRLREHPAADRDRVFFDEKPAALAPLA